MIEHTSPPINHNLAVEVTAVPLLTGNWLMLVRIAWIILAIVTGLILLTSLPAYSETFRGELAHITKQNQNSVTAVFAALSGVASLVTALLAYGLAILFFRKRFAEPVAAGLAFYLLLYAIIMAGPMEHWSSYWLGDKTLALRLQTGLVAVPTIALLVLFPNGRFVPKWSRWVLLLSVPVAFALFLLPLQDPTILTGSMSLAVMVLTMGLIGFYAVGFYTQYVRYRRFSSLVERQQTKWVVYGLALWLIYMFTSTIPYYYLESLRPNAPIPWWAAITILGWFLSLSIVPVCLTVAVMRYRLWDIDIIINRTLVYGVLTAFVIIIYVLIVGTVGTLFQTQSNWIVALFATGLIAVLFQPLRERWQRWVNQLLYGRRDEPFEVLASLGQRLEDTMSPETVYPTIVETVAQTLKLPYVALAVKRGDYMGTAVSYGKPTQSEIVYPLAYQGQDVGQLIVSRRMGDEAFAAADDRLLRNIARQAGTAVHALQLNNELHRARQQIITSREEERRRLRRDLHDGLGPSLAAQMLKIGSARALLYKQPDLADQLLAEMETDIENTLADVRRIVYDLRPPTLDQLGLVGSLRAYAESCTNGNSSLLQIQIDAPAKMPPLPAAVEVAAYHIGREGLTNVVRHAQAKVCVVQTTIDDDAANGRLQIMIQDDGCGFDKTKRKVGVGITAMHERAVELGGFCTITSELGKGTRITAVLPITNS